MGGPPAAATPPACDLRGQGWGHGGTACWVAVLRAAVVGRQACLHPRPAALPLPQPHLLASARSSSTRCSKGGRRAPLPLLPLPALPPAAKQVPAFVGGGTTDLVVDWPAVEETAAWFGVQPAKWEDTAHDAMLDTVGVRARQRLPGSALMLLGSACSWWSMLCGRAAVG